MAEATTITPTAEQVAEAVRLLSSTRSGTRREAIDVCAALIAERDALAKFKAYVHQRLDEAGVPVDPDSPHKAMGCRIGGRLDFVLAECSAMQAERDSLARLIAAADGRIPPIPAPAKEPT